MDMRLCLGVIIFFLCLSLPGCKSPEMPKIDVSFWAGDSANEGIARSQENRTMACSSSDFDDMVCLSYEDVRKIYDLLLQCERWPKSSLVMTRRDLHGFVKKNYGVVHHVFTTPVREMESIHN